MSQSEQIEPQEAEATPSSPDVSDAAVEAVAREGERLPEVELSLSSAASIPITSRPGLVPIFALCLIVMSVGFYFALKRSGQASALSADGVSFEATAEPWLDRMEPATFSVITNQPEGPHISDEPVTFSALAMDQRHTYDYTLVQVLDAVSSSQHAAPE